MYTTQVLAAFTGLLAVANAWESPQYPGFTRAWQANFVGAADGLPSTNTWNYIVGDQNDNNELQRYTKSKTNVRLSGNGALQIIPKKDKTVPKGWTSARLESKYTVTPTAGKITRVESSLRIAGNPPANKQGVWYAFWMMGDAFRKGTIWPRAGEIDIFENINGQSINHGVAHCDQYPGGACNEPVGLVNTTPIPDNKFHVWRVEIDRRKSDFKAQTMVWFKDGVEFHRITGAQIKSAGIWATLAQTPFYFIMNIAIGGNWPGQPNSKTWDGTGNMMEIGYIAHYVSV